MMVSNTASVNEEEVRRFSQQADQWWNPEGSFRFLHELGPLRVQYVCEQIMRHRSVKGHVFADLKLLDVGCGGGLLAEPLAKKGIDVVGIDASERSIDAAKSHAQESGLSIDYKAITAEDMARTGQTFDVITAFEIVEHVANLKSFMNALAKMLKPGGLMIFATVNRTKRSYLLGVVMAEYVLGWVPPGTHDWDKFVKPSELVNLWQPLGIAPCDVTGLVYQPLRRSFQFCKGKTAINYFITGRKLENAF